jgi:hypothetical protein
MYKAILLVVLSSVLSVSNASQQACPALAAEGFTESQVSIMYQAFQIGKQKDMSYSLAAIAWKESSAGKYMINLQDPSAGVFHITMINALAYLKWENNNFNRNRAAQLLVEDFQLSAEFAMINLQFWKDLHGDNWFRIWQSYNAGHNYSNGTDYANDIVTKIQKIKLCNWG